MIANPHQNWKIHLKGKFKIWRKILPCVFLGEAPSAVEATTFSWQVNSYTDTAFQNKGNNWYEVIDFVAKVETENDNGFCKPLSKNTKIEFARSSDFTRIA